MSRKRNDGDAADDPPAPDADGHVTPETAIVAYVIFVVGRGGKGKTTLVRWLVSVFAELGLPLVIADGDRTNRTLKAFFPKAVSPAFADDVTVKNWTYETLEGCSMRRESVVYDFGGGDTNVKKIAAEMRLAAFIVEDLNMIPIVIHLVGDDLDDVAQVRDLEAVFAPERTAVVMNLGVIASHHNAAEAMKQLTETPEVAKLLTRGAAIMPMPVLPPAKKIVEGRLSFADAMAGRGEVPLGITNRRLTRDWDEAMRTFLKPILDWLPGR